MPQPFTRRAFHLMTNYLPATLAPHTVESLHAIHGKSQAWIYQLALAGTACALGALPLITVDVTIRAAGIVRPMTERAEIRVPINAQIEQVLAHDNDHVAAGQRLLILRSRDLEERRLLNRSRVENKTALIADLRELSAAKSAAPYSADQESGHMVSAGNDFADAASPKSKSSPTARERIELFSQSLALRTAELRADANAVRSQAAYRGGAVARSEREFARAEALALKGLLAERDLDQARDDLVAANFERSSLMEAATARWCARLQDEESNLDALRTEAARLEEEHVQTTINAPLTGAVQGLSGLSPGTWLAAGQTVAVISPDDRLIVETLVSPHDVGLVRSGQSVRLQVDAFPYTQWGFIEGEVTAIAADSQASSANNSGNFKVTIVPSATQLSLPNGPVGHLRKGMTLTARFVVARRSLLQILYEDVSAWLNPQAQA